MMTKNGKVKINLAVLAERIDNHCKAEAEWKEEQRADTREIKNLLQDTQGKIVYHLNWHEEKKADKEISIRKVGIVVSIISIIFSFLANLFLRAITK